MRGVKNLSWFFDWLGGRGQGDPYEVMQVISPCVEISRDWPRPLKVYVGDYTAALGTNNLVLPVNSRLAQPALEDLSVQEDTRWARLWLALWISSSNNVAGDRFVLFFEQAALAARRVTLASIDLGTVGTSGVPLIGGTQAGQAGGANTVHRGIGPAYVADPDRLIFAYTGAAALDAVTVRGLFIEGPASSPLLP